MRISSLYWLLPIAFFISSCAEEISSDSVPTEKILRNYSVHFSGDGKTYVTAEFYANGGLTIPPFKEPFGQNITLNAPSKIRFNDQDMEMSKDVFGAVSYKLSFDQWPQAFNWEWTDKEGNTHTDRAKMEPIALSDNPLTNQGGNFTLRWEGAPIKKGEEVAASLQRVKDEGSAFTPSSSTIGDRSLTFDNGGYSNLNYYDFQDVNISRTLIISDTKEISTEQVAGSYIKIVYRYKKPRTLNF